MNCANSGPPAKYPVSDSYFWTEPATSIKISFCDHSDERQIALTKAQKFAIAFISAYFIISVPFMSKVDLDQPLPVRIRWVPFTSIVIAMIVVAKLSQGSGRRAFQKQEAAAIPSGNWPIRSMLVLYALAIAAILGAILAGQISWRMASVPLLVNIGLITFFAWLSRTKSR